MHIKTLESEYELGKTILLDKPYLWTSFDLVKKVRGLLIHKFKKKIKVGHAGTLDPLASGLMIICTGKATKTIENMQNLDKEYIAIIEVGKTTPSFDREKDVDKTYPYKHITRDLLESVLNQFRGETKQVPPLFSAKHINGKRAYELARKGLDNPLQANEININELEIIEYDLPLIKLKVNCSKGTYIRALARDIGVACNSGAYLTALRRTAISEYKIEDALTVEDFEKKVSLIETKI